MDVDDQQQHQSRKRGRNVGSNGGDARLTLHPMDAVDYEDDDGGKVVDGGGISGLVPWPHSSRIFRVSRATGGKDRHSKVLTSKGLRDRRVRLSVSTAIQFYDLQDRLGYDQPSKAVEWLIKKASDAISELPSLNTAAFPTTPKQASDEKRPEPEPELGESDQIHPFMSCGGGGYSNQQQAQHLTGSACSSTSETSKGSALSLSRSASRVKARARARERAAKEKDPPAPAKEISTDNGGRHHVFPNQALNPSTSFTQLLTGGASSPTSSPLFALPNPDHLFAKHIRQMSVMDYLGQQQQSFFSNFGSSSTSSTPSPPALNALPFNITATSPGGGSRDHSDHHLQQFSFSPAATGADHHQHIDGSEYNLNFSISPSLTGFTRGTLQSNAPPSLSHHQLHKFVSSMDRPPSPATPFFMSPMATESNQYPGGLDGRLHLYHGDNGRHTDLKGKGKR